MSLDNPYAPAHATLDAEQGPEKPAVWIWYVVYCVFMTLLYLLVVAAGVLFFAMPFDSEMSGSEPMVMGGVFVALGLFFAVPYGIAPFLPKRPWVWVLGIVLIGFGMTSCLTLPAALPLLLFWIKTDNQRYFGKQVASRTT